MSMDIRQNQVSAAHVMVVGCGALGNEVLKNLVLMGVTHIVAQEPGADGCHSYRGR